MLNKIPKAWWEDFDLMSIGLKDEYGRDIYQNYSIRKEEDSAIIVNIRNPEIEGKFNE